MFVNLLNRIKQAINTGVQALRNQIAASTKPTNSSLVRGSLCDLVRSKPQLIAENALLRQSGRREDITIPRPPKSGVGRRRGTVARPFSVGPSPNAACDLSPHCAFQWSPPSNEGENYLPLGDSHFAYLLGVSLVTTCAPLPCGQLS